MYRQDGTKVSTYHGMLVEKTTGDSGNVKIEISKALINFPKAMRYTIATFAPSQTPNLDSLWQGGSSAADVFPGTPQTYGGEINGYGQVTEGGMILSTSYTIYYVYNGINPIIEYAPNGSVLAWYVYAGGLHIAKVAGADTHWYHCDALGSPRKMTNENGSVVWSAKYYPFGELTSTKSDNVHGFTGKEYDSEMSLNYFCQRYYDPQIGRFMSLDPQDSPASSPYAYCVNNPLKFIDPTGEAAWNDLSERMEINADFWGNYHPTGWGNPSGWKYYHSAQMDPDFWSRGWDISNMEKIRKSMNWLEGTEWGQTEYGSAIIKELNWLWATGKIKVIGGSEGFWDRNESNRLEIGTFIIGYGKEYLAFELVHEATHSAYSRYKGFTIYRDEFGMTGYYWGLQEGAAMAFQTSLYATESAYRNHSDPYGWFGRSQAILYGVGSWYKSEINNLGNCYRLWLYYYYW